MPNARTWTKAADLTICQMRTDGSTWAEIGRTLGLSRNTVIERGRRIHAEAPPRRPACEPHVFLPDDPNRGPLPAGHPLTWGILTSEPYPEGGI